MRLSRVVGIGVLLLAVTGAVAILTSRDDIGDGSAPTVTVRLSTADGQPSALVASPKIVRTEAEWRAQLGEEAYGIVRDAGTEPAFCGGLLNEKKAGIYSCVGCGLPLFSSATKYDSETGWPSFFRPFAEENVARRWEYAVGLPRIESLCARCGAHLGHNFGDGPPPTGRRYCVNSAALVFTPLAALDGVETAKVAQLRTATFAAGCFWHVEEIFRHVPGVLGTQVGYTGGTTPEPSYEEVCSHSTGHAEAVQLTYDTSQVTYDELLAVFWDNHDPTSGDRQGADVGSQYRSAIFCHSPMQEELAKASKRRLEEAGRYEAPITTQIAPAVGFWRAEEYHQRYLQRHDSALCVTMGASSCPSAGAVTP